MKKIENYLHFYLGCEVRCPKLSGWVYSQKRTTLTKHFWLENWEKELIPVLRPLSSMSDKEKIELVTDITYNHVKFSSKESALNCFDDDNYSKEIQNMKFYSDEIVWLLSNHFDLFNLIPEGLAIDKTTLK